MAVVPQMSLRRRRIGTVQHRNPNAILHDPQQNAEIVATPEPPVEISCTNETIGTQQQPGCGGLDTLRLRMCQTRTRYNQDDPTVEVMA